jgi:hypothetical protein
MDNALDEVQLKPDAANEEAAAPAPQRLIEFVLPMVIVAVDQGTKAMVRASVPVHDSVTIIPGLFDITHALNSGAAFGILNGADFPFKTVIIAMIATAALIGVGVYAASLAHHQLIARIGLAAPSAAIDLPLKVLVQEEENGGVWVSYNTPEYIQQRQLSPWGWLQLHPGQALAGGKRTRRAEKREPCQHTQPELARQADIPVGPEPRSCVGHDAERRHCGNRRPRSRQPWIRSQALQDVHPC